MKQCKHGFTFIAQAIQVYFIPRLNQAVGTVSSSERQCMNFALGPGVVSQSSRRKSRSAFYHVWIRPEERFLILKGHDMNFALGPAWQNTRRANARGRRFAGAQRNHPDDVY